MDKIKLISIIDEILTPLGFHKQRTNSWIRKGKEVSTKVHLQKSLYGNLYYFRVYYVLNKLHLIKSDVKNECFADVDFSDDKLLYKMCDLESDVSDDERERVLRRIVDNDMSNHRYIETEKELKEMIITKKIPVFIVIKDYLGIAYSK